MRRGFKSRAEELSLRHRKNFGITAIDRLDARSFLESTGFVVWTPLDVPGLAEAHLRQLIEVDPGSWSGMTLRENGHNVIVVNPAHTKERQANTLMHEWAHVELHHKPSRADRSASGLLLLSEYPGELEEEADWLAGCMLAPREGLLWHCKNGLNTLEISERFGISTQLVNWRIGKTGVRRQLSL